MIISSEIENVEKVDNLTKAAGKSEKSILRAFARTRAKNENLMMYFNFNLIKFDPFWTGLIQYDQYDQTIEKVDNLMIYFKAYFIRNLI